MMRSQQIDYHQQPSVDISLEEVEGILDVMREKESSVYWCSDYLAGRPSPSGEAVDESWRQRMCEWMYGVVDHCNFRRDIVAISTAYLDMCLTKDPNLIRSRRAYQLAAMTSLYLAMKVYDTSFIKLESLIKLGRGLFTENDVIQMEGLILDKLKWQVHPPTTMCFVRQYMRIFPATVSPSTSYMISEISRFIAEISVCLYKFVKYPASEIAYAAILIAMEGIDEASLPNWQRQHIYYRMSSIAKISHASHEMREVTSVLQLSFEKNVDIKVLMTTIDPNCYVGYSEKSRRQLHELQQGSPKEVARAT